MAKYNSLAELFTATADAIRTKTGGTEAIVAEDFPEAIEGIETGGGGASVSSKDVNFYDYDGTVLYAYTVEEAQALTELPALPEREGLICQGWNWSLEDIKAQNRAVIVGATYITDDGKTRVYISLAEGRTSPMLGVCPNGTVTVDWGDGTEPDVLTGTRVDTVKWTPTHDYASAGDYVISLTVDGTMGFYGTSFSHQNAGILRYSDDGDKRNYSYFSAIQKVEIGNSVTSISTYAFYKCRSLTSVNIPNGVTSIGTYAFSNCTSLTSVNIPNGVTSIMSNAFANDYNLANISIPNSVTSIGSFAFEKCYQLSSAIIPNSVTSVASGAFDSTSMFGGNRLTSVNIPNGVTSIVSGAFNGYTCLTSVNIPNGVTSIGYSAFYGCASLTSVNIPNGVTEITLSMFRDCTSLTSINIPNGVTSIGAYAFYGCEVLASIAIPIGVTSIESNVFYNCYGLRYADFSHHTAVPTLSNTSAFTNIPTDCEIRVPAALYDEWIAATNWSTYASQIVAV